MEEPPAPKWAVEIERDWDGTWYACYYLPGDVRPGVFHSAATLDAALALAYQARFGAHNNALHGLPS